MALAKFRAHRLDIFAVAALCALWGLFFWRLLTPVAADRMTFAPGDFITPFFALSDYQAERVWQGQIPLWNPYQSAGMPLAADLERMVWYPPRWIAIWLAGPGGWKLESLEMEVAAHYLIASLLAYAFFRRTLRHRLAALAGALMFAYGGYLTGYPMLQVSIAETATWLPLVLLGIHISATGNGAGGAALAGLGLGLSLLVGFPQNTLLTGYLALAYLILCGRQNRLGWLPVGWRAALTGIVGAGLGAAQVLPAFEFMLLSSRTLAYHYADKSSGFLPVELLQAVWPGSMGPSYAPLYIGVAGLILAAGALTRPGATRLFWGGALAVSALLALGRGSIVYDALYLVAPGFNLFRQQERAALLAAWSLALLAASQLDWLFSAGADSSDDAKQGRRRLAWLALAHLTVCVVAVMIIAAPLLQQGTLNAATAAANPVTLVAVFSLLMNGWIMLHAERPILARGLIIALIVIDLFSFSPRWGNFVPQSDSAQPITPQPEALRSPGSITWHVDGSGGVQGRSTLYRIPDIYGNTPLQLESTTQLYTLPVDRFWELLSVRYLTLAGTLPPDTVSATALGTYANYDGAEYISFEIQDPRPFAWLVYDFREASGSPDFARQIIADPRINLREIAVTLYPPPLALPGQRPALSAISDFRMVTPERIEMMVSTGDNALLTLALPKYPGWRATINGQPAPIIDAYAGLTAVPIPAGENQKVVVEFFPIIQVVGGALSALSVSGLIGYALIAGRRKSEGRASD